MIETESCYIVTRLVKLEVRLCCLCRCLLLRLLLPTRMHELPGTVNAAIATAAPAEFVQRSGTCTCAYRYYSSRSQPSSNESRGPVTVPIAPLMRNKESDCHCAVVTLTAQGTAERKRRRSSL